MSDSEIENDPPTGEQIDLFLQHSNLYNSETTALKELIADFNVIIANPNVSISSLELVQNELQIQQNKYIQSWSFYEAHILGKTSLHTSARREYRQLKREAFSLLNSISQLKDDKTKVPTPVPTSEIQSLPKPKLAAIEIPKFDGDVAKWTAFWDIFNSLVHRRTDLENVIKFTTLRSHLTGRAFKTVEGISVTHANYESAVELLKKQFGKTDKLVTQLTRDLQNLSIARNHYEDLLEFK